MAVIDASVLSAIYLHRFGGQADTCRHHEICRTWFEEARLREEPLHAPAFLLVELSAALSRQRVAESDIREALAQVRLRITLHEENVERSIEVAIRCATRGADSIYIALAEGLGHSLVTADDEQATRGAQIIGTLYLPG